MAKLGRKQKPYESSTGEIIPGLAHDTNGRWRIVSTGVRFSETNEAIAIARFKAMQPQPEAVRVEVEATLLVLWRFS